MKQPKALCKKIWQQRMSITGQTKDTHVYFTRLSHGRLSLICLVTQVHHQCLSTEAAGCFSCTNKGKQAPCRDNVFELPCLWSDTCMEWDKGQKRRAQGLIRRTVLVNSLKHLLYNSFFNDGRKWYSTNDESLSKIARTLNRLLRASQPWFICKTITRQAAFGFENNENKSFLLATEIELNCKLVAAHRWLCVRAAVAQNGIIWDWGKVSNVSLIEPNNVVRGCTESSGRWGYL